MQESTVMQSGIEFYAAIDKERDQSQNIESVSLSGRDFIIECESASI